MYNRAQKEGESYIPTCGDAVYRATHAVYQVLLLSSTPLTRTHKHWKHSRYGVKAEHYPLFRAVLLETFHHYLGPRFTPEMQQAWEEAIEMISSQMLEGADMLPLQEEGEFR